MHLRAAWLHPTRRRLSPGELLRWLPVLLAASFPIFVVGALAGRGSPVEAAPPPAPDSPITTPILASFTPEVQRWAPSIQRWSEEYDLPQELVATVMQIESCGHPTVRSAAGAAGLFQVMPFHFAAGENPVDPETNAFRGLSYLKRSLELSGGNPALALAGYNGGHGQISRAVSVWPAETQRYVRWGVAILADLDLRPSPGIQAWLDAGGASLCRRAAQTQASG